MTDRQCDIECYINLFKSAYGYKPTVNDIDLNSMSDDEIAYAIKVVARVNEEQRV
jgi:hypothetical protein